jgi:hypothetical protein
MLSLWSQLQTDSEEYREFLRDGEASLAEAERDESLWS